MESNDESKLIEAYEKAIRYLILKNLDDLIELQDRLLGFDSNRQNDNKLTDNMESKRSVKLNDLIKNKKNIPSSYLQYLKNPQNKSKLEKIQKLFEQELENYRQIQRIIYSYGK
ncbi:unnamed protein product [Brachionus calyciflorus]|uniref:Uncharacterized protein n=1 Tax=Brachionus calyciflorus TaxID=104777 RepID=A0A814FF95_9BILA|nr:unnamed protein product [Brachionus calyciflorus]